MLLVREIAGLIKLVFHAFIHVKDVYLILYILYITMIKLSKCTIFNISLFFENCCSQLGCSVICNIRVNNFSHANFILI